MEVLAKVYIRIENAELSKFHKLISSVEFDKKNLMIILVQQVNYYMLNFQMSVQGLCTTSSRPTANVSKF